MSSGQQPVTQQTTQVKDPWSAAQPYLQQTMGSASALYNQNVGYTPYSGQTQADLSPYTTQATTQMGDTLWQDAANRGTAGVNAARDLGLNMIQNQGLTPGIQGAIGGLGTAGNQYSDIYSQNSGQQNPYLLAQIAANDRRIGDRVNSSMSGAGRYGSGAHTDVLSRSLAESADPILAQDYAQRQQTMLGATQGLAGTQQNIADLYGQGLQRAGQWSQEMPALDAARFQPAESLMALGDYYNQRSQAQLNDQIKQYNATQAYPWEQLARENAIIGGAGGLGGTSVTSSPIQQPSTLQSALGGGLAGAGLGSMFGPVGSGIGAAGGGLLGLMR